MKKTALLFIFALTFISFSFGQRYPNRSEFQVSLGLNTIANLGTQSPIEDIDKWAFSTPFAIGVEYKWSDLFGVEEVFSFNKFSDNSIIDGRFINEEFSYFSADTHIKYYFGEHFLDSEFIELFAKGGVGLFKLNETNGSFNFGGGITYWIRENIGISGQGVGKFAFDSSNKLYDSNHFQFSLMFTYRL